MLTRESMCIYSPALDVVQQSIDLLAISGIVADSQDDRVIIVIKTPTESPIKTKIGMRDYSSSMLDKLGALAMSSQPR